MTRGHSEALLPLVERVLQAAQVGFPALSRVAVVVGPGSGIRIGISAARAIGLACGIPVVGVSSLPAFAAPLIGAESGVVIAAAIDAKHGQVYVQGFSAKGQSLLPARLAKVRDAVRALEYGQLRLVESPTTMMAIEAWSAGGRTRRDRRRPISGRFLRRASRIAGRPGTGACPSPSI